MKKFESLSADLLSQMGAESGVVKITSGNTESDTLVVRVVAVESGLDTGRDLFDGYELTLDMTGDTFEISAGGDEPAFHSAPYQTLVDWVYGI